MMAAYRLQIRGLLVLAVLLQSSPGLASDVAAAEALFQDGRRLMLEGKTKAGCDKLQASQRLDPSSGTLINLATCHATLGLTATAWAEFLAASRMANAQGRPNRAAEAQRRAAQLEPLVSYLTVKVDHVAPGLKVTRDGVEVAPSAFGVELPVDPGSHTLAASAPGYADWSTTITIGKAAERQMIEVPALVGVPKEPAPSAPKPEPQSAPPAAASAVVHTGEIERDKAPSEGRSLGPGFWIAGGATLAATGVTTFFGILSLKSYSDADKACPEHVGCEPHAMRSRDRADTQANVANVALGTAVVAAALTGLLYLLSDGEEQSAAEFRAGSQKFDAVETRPTPRGRAAASMRVF